MLRSEVPQVEQLEWGYHRLRPKYKKVIRKFDFRDFDELAWLGRSWEIAWLSAKEYRAPLPPESSFLPEFAYRAETTPAAHKRTQVSAVTEAATPLRNSGEPSLGTRSTVDWEDRNGIESRGSGHQPGSAKDKFNKGKESNGKRNFKDSRVAFKVGGGQQSRSTSAEKALKDTGTEKEVICFKFQKPGHFQAGCPLPRKLACYRCKAEGYIVRNCPNCSGYGEKKQWDRSAVPFNLPWPKKYPI